MTGIPCHYYDGRTSRRRAAVLTITGTGQLAIDCEDMEERLVLADVKIPGRVADTPRCIHLPGGGVCEVRNNDALDELRSRAMRGHEPPAERLRRLVHTLDSTGRGTLAALALTASILYSFTRWGAPAIAGAVVAATPPQIEELIGDNALDLFEQLDLLDPSALEPNRRNELLAAFESLKKNAGVETADLRFHSSRALGPNAFAVPGGTIVITDELVELAEHDEEIIAVLAHELGHVEGRHVIRRLAQTSSMLVLWTAFTGDVSAAGLALLGPEQLIAQSYSRSFEQDADLFAAECLLAAGISPTRLGDILERIETETGSAGFPTFLSSHPGAEARARSAEEAAERLIARPETRSGARGADETGDRSPDGAADVE